MNDKFPDTWGIATRQRHLWEQKLKEYGDLPQAVGSESFEHKELRYRHISRVFDGDTGFSLLDVGAGVGDYFGYLNRVFPEKNIMYRGLEITSVFCQRAREKYPGITIDTANILEDNVEPHDYVVMCGIFHQRGEVSLDEWQQFMERMLIRGFQICRKGMSFNVLSHHAEYLRDGNFYVDLNELQDLIVEKLSRFYTLDHALPLFEATIRVCRPVTVLSKYPQKEFSRYIKN